MIRPGFAFTTLFALSVCATPLAALADSNDAILKALAEKQKNLNVRKHQYTYSEREVQRGRDSDGNVTHEEVTEYQIRFVNDHSIARVLKKNGVALSGDDLASEEDRVQKEALEAAKTKAPGSTVENVLNFTTITTIKHVSYNNVKALEIDFQPRDSANANDRVEEFFSHLAGKMLVDEDKGDLLHMDAKLATPLRVLGGIAGSVNAGSSIAIDTALVNDEVRIANKELRKIVARKFLSNMDMEYDITYSNYKKDVK